MRLGRISKIPTWRDIRSILLGMTLGGAALLCFVAGRWPPIERPSQSLTTTVRSSVRTLYAPKALIEFAGGFVMAGDESERDFKRLLRSRGLQAAWYAMTIRDHFADGRFRDETIIEYPGLPSGSYPRARAMLHALGGGREVWGAFDPTQVKVVIVPDDLASDLPAKALADLVESVQVSERRSAGGR